MASGAKVTRTGGGGQQEEHVSNAASHITIYTSPTQEGNTKMAVNLGASFVTNNKPPGAHCPLCLPGSSYLVSDAF